MTTYPKTGNCHFDLPSRDRIQSSVAAIRQQWNQAERNKRRQEAIKRQQELFAPIAPYAILAGYTC